MPPATQRTQRKRPGDLTGVRGQQLAQEAARQKAEAKRQVVDALEDERETRLSTEVDYSTPVQHVKRPVRKPKTEVVVVDGEETEQETSETELVIEEIEVKPRTRKIRVNYPIEEMTFGREVLQMPEYDEYGNVVKAPILGNLRRFDFEEGRWYTVDEELAEHLAFLGYIYE